MINLSRADARNLLLRSLSDEDFALLAPHLTELDTPTRMSLCEPDVPYEHVYFLGGGVSSVVSHLSDGSQVEVGLFGREGIGPVAALMGADSSPYEIFMQIGGEGALAISAATLRDLIREHTTLRESLQRFAMVFLVQTATSAASNASHPIEQRLARWLLMCHDRVDGDEMALTHEFIGLMLGIRRSSVTVTLHVLEGMGAIRSTRGLITVRDRNLLEELAGESYGQSEAQYRKLIGPFPV